MWFRYCKIFLHLTFFKWRNSSGIGIGMDLDITIGMKATTTNREEQMYYHGTTKKSAMEILLHGFNTPRVYVTTNYDTAREYAENNDPDGMVLRVSGSCDPEPDPESMSGWDVPENIESFYFDRNARIEVSV